MSLAHDAQVPTTSLDSAVLLRHACYMTSIAESKRLVQQAVSTGTDHDAILASLRDEIDNHNRERSSARRRSKRHRDVDEDNNDNNEVPRTRSESALRFHFKHDKHRSLKDRSRHKHRKHTTSKTHESTDRPKDDHDSTNIHPFPREPTSPTAEPSDDAFLASLLDALADDEAASYWESVYSQPIHTYERPSVQAETGELGQMDDEEYAAWVKRKMWEKKHPEVLIERDRMKAKRQEEEELKRRRREEFVRKRQKEAWDRASQTRSSNEQDYEFDFTSTNTANRAADTPSASQWQHAWVTYLKAWEDLKTSDPDQPQAAVSKLLPWPVLPTKPPTRPHIEDFLRNMPRSDADTRRRLLKVERVRWHPDKIQQRFQGQVDGGTMKVVTGIFQVIDALWTAEMDGTG